MRKENDLINETGPMNWLDVVAGEAVLFGHATGNMELSAKGTILAKMIREVSYCCDDFEKVNAYGRSLEIELDSIRKEHKSTMFLDELFVGDRKKKSLLDWEFDFIFVDGRYEIKMYLPVYYDKNRLSDDVKEKSSASVCAVYADPSFASCEVEETRADYSSQLFVNKMYYDKEGKMLRRTVDFNHEGSPARGWIEYFYLDDFASAVSAWQEVKTIFISSRKK